MGAFILTVICAVSLLTVQSVCEDVLEERSAKISRLWPGWNPYPIGDPKNCFYLGDDMNRLEVLPGFGWDNLRNIEMGQVLATNYSQCKTTADRKYLLPDNAFVTPVKRSKVDMFSEVFDHWNSYTSTTANSVNLEASYSVASGSFAADFKYEEKPSPFHTQLTIPVL